MPDTLMRTPVGGASWCRPTPQLWRLDPLVGAVLCSIETAPRNNAAKALQAHRRANGTPAVSFTSTTVSAYRDVRDRGVVVVCEPEAMDYGGTDAVFENGGSNALNPDEHVPAGVGG